MLMNFPNDYPMSPPTLRFTSEFWHPNGNAFQCIDASGSNLCYLNYSVS